MTTFYHCTNKHCRAYHVETSAVSPAEIRQTTGRSFRCAVCGQIMRWLRAL